MIGWMVAAMLLGLWRRDAERSRRSRAELSAAFDRACTAGYADWRAQADLRVQRDDLVAHLANAQRQITILEAFLGGAHHERLRAIHLRPDGNGAQGVELDVIHTCPDCQYDEVLQ